MTAATTYEYSSAFDNLELVRLHEFSLILNSTHNIDQIIQESAKAMREIFDGAGCHILLARAVRDYLHLETAIHDGGKPFPPDVDETKGISGQTFKTGQIIVVKDAAKDPRVTRRMYEYFNHRSVLSAPIIVKGEIVGVIVLYAAAPGKYSERDGEFLVMLGSHLGLAVENARLLYELQRYATTDALTGVFNRRYLREQLDHLLNAQPNRLISLIMLDVNYLKVINDTYGHLAGDQVLQTVADVLKQATGEAGIIARFGGDEFAIVLPDIASEQEVMQVGEKIEKLVNQTVIMYKDHPIRVDLAWGTASARAHSIQNLDEIISAADRNLYKMKLVKQHAP